MAQQVYTLLVEVGRAPDDGLPEGSTGAGLVCYASGVDLDEAIRETVAVLKQADLAPLEVQATAPWTSGWPRGTRSPTRNGR